MTLYKIQLPAFEGPLDLLLRLIEREELDVTTVALARVTDQYLERLAELEQRQPKDLADFLVVAAKLVLIKSAALLPRSPRPSPEDDVEDVGHDLVHQLQIYKRFKEIADLLHTREEGGLHTYIRLAPSPRRAPEPDLSQISLQDLLLLAQEALDLAPGPPVGQVVSPVTVTIEEQIEHIERKLAQTQHVIFRTLLSQAATRLEVIVTLLAVLELIKQDRVSVRQDALFGEIVIEKPPPTTATNPRA
ncbi:MAG: segregation/condensation protein A [Anaerolineae bacterium]|nr:segregation/condensation protein A [Anaerolineae bacterium]